MVSPTRPTSVNTSGATYSAVPNPDVASPELNRPSPDINEPHARRDSAYLSPEGADTPILGRDSMYMPAPSMISRDSTHESLLTPGAGLPSSRSSWGSNAALAAGAAGIAGSEARRPGNVRGQSNLHHSSVGWNNTSDDRLSVSDEDDGMGHIAPAGAAAAGGAAAATMSEKPAWAREGGYAPKKSRKVFIWIGAGIAALVVVGLAVGLGVGLTVSNKSSSSGNNASAGADAAGTSSHGGSHTASGTASAAPSATPTSGTQGSLITLEDGSTMTYDNPHGGTWVWDEANPFNNEAQAQSWTKPLNQNWTWGVDKIYGVNLGGWLNTEPFIVPALYEIYANGSNGQTAIDEFTLSQNMGDNLTAAMTEHYETFITERDFMEIASAGLNWIRLPIAHWAIETWPGEPYLERVSWTYILKAIKWARKYGIRLQLDLHTVPGSQNGWNHSGKIGTINWLNGATGMVNAQRALDYVRTLAQFISQPEYAPVIPMFGFTNEPNANGLGQRAVGSWYHEVHNMVREITGFGEGNGPYLSFHDGFIGIQQWYDFLPGADRFALDQHPYMIFGDQQTGSLAQIATRPCQMWATATNQTSLQFGANSAGEWSAAPNDCGLWINSVGGGSRYDGTHADYIGKGIGSCDQWNDWTTWDQDTKDSLKHLVMASMDSFQNFFFWTWKIGNSTGPIAEVNPFWNYQLGLREGWIPNDPREAIGMCLQDGVSGTDFSGTFSEPYMTGGPGAGTIAASDSASYPWPPASLTNVAAGQMTSLAQLTQTGTPITMPGPSFTSPGSSETINAGNGWFNSVADTRSAYATIAGCAYPPEYSGANLGVSGGACGAGLTQPTKRNAAPEPVAVQPTAAPRR